MGTGCFMEYRTNRDLGMKMGDFVHNALILGAVELGFYDSQALRLLSVDAPSKSW